MGHGAEQHGHLASEMFKSPSQRSPLEDLFEFFNLCIAMVLKGSGIQPCLYMERRCVCVCMSVFTGGA